MTVRRSSPGSNFTVKFCKFKFGLGYRIGWGGNTYLFVSTAIISLYNPFNNTAGARLAFISRVYLIANIIFRSSILFGGEKIRLHIIPIPILGAVDERSYI